MMLKRVTLTTYKFRAECFLDVAKFLTILAQPLRQVVVGDVHITQARADTADCTVSILTSASLDRLKMTAESVPDGHVIRETLQRADRYTGERSR